MRHGALVQVAYVDLGEPEGKAEHPEVLRRIEEEGLPYPLVAVNGTLRLAGSTHYSHVLPLVDEAIASQSGS